MFKDKATLKARGPKLSTAGCATRLRLLMLLHASMYTRPTQRPQVWHCTFRDILLKRTTSAVLKTNAILLSARPSPALTAPEINPKR